MSLKTYLSDFSQDIANQSQMIADNADRKASIEDENLLKESYFTALGKQYYTRLREEKTAPPEEDVFLFTSIDAANERIFELEQQLARARGKIICPICRNEQSLNTNFCLMCGNPLSKE